MDNRFIVIRSSDGVVVNVIIGSGASITEGFELVEQQGEAALVGIGWTRNGDGSFTDTSADYDPFA